MPSKAELKKAIDDARKAKNSADHAIKKLVDVHVPKNAKKARGTLIDKLRSIVQRMEERIPALRKRLEAKRRGGGDKAANAFSKYLNISESPPYSNKGPFPISESQKFILGYDGVPYCGCCAGFFAIEVGGAKIPSKARLAYVPYIGQDARAGINGLTLVPISQMRRGDLVGFNFDGGVEDHVAMALGPIVNGMTDCAEANTSSGTSGSQSNGGGIYRRQRPISQVAFVARPNYS